MPASPPEDRFVIYIPEPFPKRSVSTLDPRFVVRQGRAGEAYSEAELVPMLADVDAIAISSRDPIAVERFMLNPANQSKDATAPSYEHSHVDGGKWTFLDVHGALLGAEVASDEPELD